MKPAFSPSDLSAVKDLLSAPRRIVITTHYKPDGDALGSSLGLQSVLQKIGHHVVTVVPSEFPAFLSWMQDAETAIDFLQNKDKATEAFRNAELVICLDFNDPARVEGMMNVLLEAPAPRILIDHHLDPKPFCNYTFSETRVSSTCELIVHLLIALELQSAISGSAAEAFYCGIMTDTGSFRFSSVSAETHEIVAMLLAKGARNYVVHEKIYDTSSEWRLRFLGHSLLNRMVVIPEYHTVYFTAWKEEMEAFHHESGDTEGLVNYGLSITGMKMAVLFSERDKVVKISFRSKGDFSVKDLAEKHFEGGGHKNAAGGKSTESLQQTVKRFVSVLPSYSEALK
jgi:phosphoesterase RecJ-like protein